MQEIMENNVWMKDVTSRGSHIAACLFFFLVFHRISVKNKSFTGLDLHELSENGYHVAYSLHRLTLCERSSIPSATQHFSRLEALPPLSHISILHVHSNTTTFKPSAAQPFPPSKSPPPGGGQNPRSSPQPPHVRPPLQSRPPFPPQAGR